MRNYQNPETVVEIPSPAPILNSPQESGAHWAAPKLSPQMSAIFADINKNLHTGDIECGC